MWTFIAKYWIEFLFGLFISIAGFFVRRYLKLEKENSQREREDFKNLLTAEIEKKSETSLLEDASIREDIKLLKKGVLSFQGRMFKDHCRLLLEPSVEITLAEFEEIESEHAAYNGLGGNHEGDVLYGLVKRKFEHEIEARHEQQ